MDSTKALIAEDPAQRLITKPTETTSAWPLRRMVSTVLPTRLVATSWLKMPCRKYVDLVLDLADGVRPEPSRHVADRAEQGQQQRRGGQRGPEGGLRAHPEQRVAPRLGQGAGRRPCASGAGPGRWPAGLPVPARWRCDARARSCCRPARRPGGATAVPGARCATVALRSSADRDARTRLGDWLPDRCRLGTATGAAGRPTGAGRRGSTWVRSSSEWLALVTTRACLFLATLGEKTFRTATKL